MDEWVPLGMDAEPLEALSDGVPPWLRDSVWAWIQYSIHTTGDPSDLVKRFDRKTRRRQPVYPAYSALGISGLAQELDESETLRFVDFLVAHGQFLNPFTLSDILVDGGSLWTVGERAGRAGLVRRVPEGVQLAGTEIIQRSGSAGALLAEAWQACFGMDPDPEEAYEKSIKAVEEAGAHVVSPKNAGTTLGTMCRDMEAQKDWRIPLGEVPRTPSNDAATKMARALWSGQESRHGGNGYRKPTQEEAEAAVLLAVPLVQWFTSGVLARR
ncbi:hypothetical protein MT356_08890 [Rathayibacter festucae]|uniref:hypothetical protein n=1 Tax=Rathayibacter festucae TaxID=110937 RepID=UPI001FB4A15A|nr:hypothetical protein [Rathayibacter festucae]MCJ1699838.1 hypothetical protein [Rathayibacter festucae]